MKLLLLLLLSACTQTPSHSCTRPCCKAETPPSCDTTCPCHDTHPCKAG